MGLPILCADKSEKSTKAKNLLEQSGIDYELCDCSEFPPCDWSLPFLIDGRAIYGGLEAIKTFSEYIVSDRECTIERNRRM